MKFTDNLEMAMECLHKRGAFLTCKHKEEVNTMTISWGSIGFMWRKPVFTVMVRESRHTHKLLESSGVFTVTIPLDESMKEALSVCGSKSGRDIDKLKECSLQVLEGKSISVPVIKGKALQYECKVLYKDYMGDKFLDKDVNRDIYGDKNYHTVYYGEIVECYESISK